MKIVIGSDHGGIRLKEVLKQHLAERGLEVTDAGTCTEEPCDYPDIAVKVCRDGNASPDMLPCMLLIRKNGGEITNKTLESVMRIADNRNAAKALSLYVSAYEKMNERRSACRKRFESLISETNDDHDILSKLFGV